MRIEVIPPQDLFGNHRDSLATFYSDEEVERLVRYCLGIILNSDAPRNTAERTKKALQILLQIGHRASNYMIASLYAVESLEVVVDLLAQVYSQHRNEHEFADTFLRNLVGAYSNPEQREGARLLLLRPYIMEAAILYVLPMLKRNYNSASSLLKEAALNPGLTNVVLGGLTWAVNNTDYGINAAFLLQHLESAYAGSSLEANLA